MQELGKSTKRVLSLIVMTIIMAVISVCISAPANASTPLSNDQQTVADNINAQRTAAGSSVLPIDTKAQQVAQQYAQQLAADSTHALIHNPNLLAQVAPADSAGEDLSQYYPSTQVVSAWMNSSSHRGNIINNTWQGMGVGYVYDTQYGFYWFVTVFVHYPASAPAQVSAPVGQVSSAAADSLSFSWSAPVSAATVTGYRVFLYDTSGNQVRMVLVNASVTDYTFANLIRGMGYRVRVSAGSSNGWSELSTYSSQVTVAGLKPATVQQPQLIALSNTLLRATWINPNANGSAISAYTITVYRDGALYTSISTDGDAYLYNLADLEPGHAYKVSVSATNALGTSDASVVSNELTIAAPAPAPAPVPTQSSTPTPVTPSPAPTTEETTTLPIQIVYPTNNLVEPVLIKPVLPKPAPAILNIPDAIAATQQDNATGAVPAQQLSVPKAIAAPVVSPVSAIPATPKLKSKQLAKSSIALNWSTTGVGGGKHVKYMVKLATGSKTVVSKSVTVTHVKLSGLKRHTVYKLKLYAVGGKTSAPLALNLKTK